MSMNNIPQSTTVSNATAGVSCFDANHIDVTTIEDLKQVGSDKWTRYPGCTTEACDFRDNLARLSSRGFTVLGISKDPGQ